jgi:hypothetical protein
MKIFNCLLLFLTITSNSSAQYTLIPDVNFENALINSSYDDVQDGQVLTASIDNIVNLYLMGSNISDLTGIEDFNNLEKLIVSQNNLVELNLEQNVNLKTLWAGYNQLTEISLNANTLLEEIELQGNAIEFLDVNPLSNLKILNISACLMPTINLSYNTNLEELYCSSSKLTGLNLSACPNLLKLSCFDNIDLVCLNLRNGSNSNMTSMNAYWSSNLNCITVDDVEWATANWTVDNMSISSNTSFSENCGSDCNLSLINQTADIISIYPNPFQKNLNIQLNSDDDFTYKVIDFDGKIIQSERLSTSKEIDLSFLEKGFYFIKVENDSDNYIFKVIKDF